MKFRAVLIAGCLVAATALPAVAHHSFAMFDGGKVQTLEGTVTELEWINPHSWLHVMTVNKEGKPELWAFEMGGPGQLMGRGWTRDSVKAGDKVTVTFHPMRDGSHGGSEMTVKLQNGTILGGQGGFGEVFDGAQGRGR